MKCTPSQPKGMSAYRLRYRNQNLAYDTLSSALHSVSMRRSLSLDASLIRVYPCSFSNFDVSHLRTFAHNRQMNGYVYCINSPLVYIDPTGNGWDPKTHYVNLGSAFFGITVGLINPCAGAVVAVIAPYALDYYWDWSMAHDWYEDNYMVAPDSPVNYP